MFLTEEAVVGCLSEVGDELCPDEVGILMWHVVQQVLGAPSYTDFPDRSEMGAVIGIGGDAMGVDDEQGGVLRGAVRCHQMAQALAAAGTLAIETVGVLVGHRLIVEIVFHDSCFT